MSIDGKSPADGRAFVSDGADRNARHLEADAGRRGLIAIKTSTGFGYHPHDWMCVMEIHDIRVPRLGLAGTLRVPRPALRAGHLRTLQRSVVIHHAQCMRIRPP
jgi:hypothetical protein